jgi:thiosulfate/3-mercaptopyruvate sulfurtransferase
MGKMWWLVVIGVLAALVPVVATAQEIPHIVSTAWLAAHPVGEEQALVDVREKIQDYWAGHIPGAQYVSPEALRWPDAGVPVKVMPYDQLAKLLSAMGVTRGTTLIIYAEDSNFRPAYLAWALDYLGHKQWAIVDGGFKQWQSEGRATTQVYPNVVSCPCFSYTGPNPAVRATTPQVLTRKPQTVLLDVRATKAYTGEEGFWIRKGHIPGAISHPWTNDVTATGAWKSKDELMAAYQAQGVTPDKTIIVSCGQGQMSAHTYVTLKYLLGFPNVSNYDGGFNEWSSAPSLPVKTGNEP